MPKEIVGENWLDTNDMSKMLGVQPRIVRKYIKEKRFEAFRIAGQWWAKEEAVKGYIAKGSNMGWAA